MPERTIEELKTNAETQDHINLVRVLLRKFAVELLKRGETHDLSKFSDEEVKTFTEYTPKLKTTTYGSDDYNRQLAEMQVALDHHYGNNRHHPEHFENGIKGMTLVDLVEMFIDWSAATKRHSDGNIMRSIELNEKRFSIPPELSEIFRNTARDFTSE